jgi:Zinc carboxypeptidase
MTRNVASLRNPCPGRHPVTERGAWATTTTGPLAVLVALMVALLAAPSALAQATRPGGPWTQENQTLSLERLHTYAELTAALQRIEQRSGGRIAVGSVGTTNQGRYIWAATAGTGATDVLFITQQHGDEPLGTEAALKLLQHLATSASPAVTEILSELTLTIVVRANPDGAERFQRQNVDPGCSGAFCLPGVGYDVNRYHDPSLAPAANPVPEAVAIQLLYEQLQPAIVVDYHHQGTYVDANGDMITASVFWPNAPGVPTNALNASKQLTRLIYDTLMPFGYANVSQYPGTPIPGIARNAYGLLGSASVLVEMRGLGIGQKSSGKLIRTFLEAMWAAVSAAANDSLDAIDPALADQIPERGPEVFGPAPHPE